MYMSQGDHERIVEASWALGVHTTEGDLITGAMENIFQVVGADEAVFNAVDMETGQASADADPETHLAPVLQAQLAEVLDDHPVVSYLATTPHVRPARISDILPFRQFERTRTYQALFRPRALRHQLVIPVEVGETRRAGMVYALNRCDADFDQRAVDLAMGVALLQ
jgi:GAF domain-containing protein